jgi:hypothetical protein
MAGKKIRPCSGERGLSETVSIALIAILVIALAGVIAGIVLGVITLYPKSAYIVVQSEAKNTTQGNWYISVYDAGGDAAYLNRSGAKEGMPIDFQLISPNGILLFPLSDSPLGFRPGTTLFIFNRSGIPAVTTDEAVARAGSGLGNGTWKFSVIDSTDNVLIYSATFRYGSAPPLTPSPTTIVTSVPTPPVPLPGSIEGRVTNSTTGQGLAGWTVRVYYSQNGTLISTVTTDGNGFYLFTGLKYSPAEQYRVTVLPVPSGWTPVTPASGSYSPVILNPGGQKYQTGIDFSSRRI